MNRVSIDGVCVAVISELIRETVLVSQDAETVIDLVAIASRVNLPVVLVPGSVYELCERLAANAKTRDFAYTCLARIKYHLKDNGYRYEDLINLICEIGSDSKLAGSNHADIYPQQRAYNQAYLLDWDIKLKTLIDYEWIIPVILFNVHMLDIFDLLSQLKAIDKPKRIAS